MCHYFFELIENLQYSVNNHSLRGYKTGGAVLVVFHVIIFHSLSLMDLYMFSPLFLLWFCYIRRIAEPVEGLRYEEMYWDEN